MKQTPAMSARAFRFSRERPPRRWVTVTQICAVFVVLALVWASQAEVDERSRAEGKVIASSKTQIIQSTESGVVTEILVRAGQQVTKGQQLIRLDDTNSSSSAGEVAAKVTALSAQIARLRIEYSGNVTSGADYVCPEEIKAKTPEICDNEASLLEARAASKRQGQDVLEQRVQQRQSELNEAQSNQVRLTNALNLSQEKLDLLMPLWEKNLVAQTELLTVQAEVSDLQGQLAALKETIIKSQSALSEAKLQVEQAELQFREAALTDLTDKLAQLSSAEETLRGATDRVSRTEVRSPVDGIVSSLAVNTIGAFVNAGETLLDIVPIDEKLNVEARLMPSDVAFIIPGQKATIKLTAYDYSIFGGLEGEVLNVSADSITDPQTRETYYIVLLSTDASELHYHGKDLPILPGMVTTVEILTGKKTILSYLLKPVNKARDDALRER